VVVLLLLFSSPTVGFSSSCDGRDGSKAGLALSGRLSTVMGGSSIIDGMVIMA